MDRIIKYSLVSLLLIFLSLFPTQANADISTWQKGFTLRLNNQTPQQVDVALTEMKDAGIDYLALSPGWLTFSTTSSNVDRKWGTSSDEIIVYTINKAHSMGMRVLLKPHLDIATGEWRASINPTNKAEFFQNYTNMIMVYANIAEQNNVEQFSVGAELVKLSINPDNKDMWVALINEVKTVYDGELTYSANADKYLPLDEVGKLTFWSELDYMGMSFYRPLSDNDTPTIESIKNEWKSFEDNYILPRYEQIQKPVLFTEIGYRSINGASIKPWDYAITNTVDTQEQSDLYSAFFEYWGNKDYVKGVNFWEWDVGVTINPATNKSYTPQSKPVEEVIKKYFLDGFIPESPELETENLISDLNKYTAGKLISGALLYSDRSYVISSIPELLKDQEYIVVKNADKSNTSSVDFLTFNINKPAYVYIAYDKRAKTLPNWLKSFTKTPVTVTTTDTAFAIYQKKHDIGKVSLGGNSAIPAKGASSNYFVIVTENKLMDDATVTSPTKVTPSLPATDKETIVTEGKIIIDTPDHNSQVNGEKKLKIYIKDLSLDQYTATYSVDGYEEVDMPNDVTSNYKQAKIDFDQWNWNELNIYKVVIRARNLNGEIIDTAGLTLYID